MTLTEIIEDVAARHNLTPATIQWVRGGRTHEALKIAHARQEVMWRAREEKRDDGTHRFSLPYIASRLGGMDHTTVRHGALRHAERIAQAASKETAHGL